MAVVFRRTHEADVDRVMEIIAQAQRFFQARKIDQWQNGYPNPQSIISDIRNGYGYVLEKAGRIVATAAISFDGEPTYRRIVDGRWSTDEPYAVVHRIAVESSEKGAGLASTIMKQVETMCRKKGISTIRIDTHRDNRPMQRVLEKNHFRCCGIIFLADGSERLAFDKRLSCSFEKRTNFR
ncbi:MAG: GNAT family N-acetyltransferase [Sporolactobacillus sp.]|jgi:GNAT superfamily N-acetyltransferase|nr:GNAT family N-acetyltransferase [Sporolactobacillus sp.]